MNIILFGAQGSGKGTQADKLASALNIPHVASGDLFRDAIKTNSELGRKAKEYMDQGNLVPDDVTVNMVLDRIRRPDCALGVLLDGFPRTIAQAHALDNGMEESERRIDVAVYLNVPRDVLLKRLSGRYICQAHQHVYNINTNPPKVAGKCDIDGSDLYQRADDTGPAVQKRLDIFFNATIRLLDYYRIQEKLVEVNGNQSISQVQQDLVDAVKQHAKQ